jgi:hypothetical protein
MLSELYDSPKASPVKGKVEEEKKRRVRFHKSTAGIIKQLDEEEDERRIRASRSLPELNWAENIRSQFRINKDSTRFKVMVGYILLYRYHKENYHRIDVIDLVRVLPELRKEYPDSIFGDDDFFKRFGARDRYSTFIGYLIAVWDFRYE